MEPGRALRIGGGYALAYALATIVLPRPSPPSLATLIALLAVLLPTALAIAATARAARASGAGEQPFWVLLCAAGVAQAANVVVYAIHTLGLPEFGSLRLAGHMGYYTYSILVFVALLARPDRTRPGRERSHALLESLIAVVSGYFLLFYFVLLPYREARYPWSLVFTLQEFAPALLAFYLTHRVRDAPFRQVYAILAGGLLAGAAVGVWPNVQIGLTGGDLFRPFDVAWMLPLIGIAAAAGCPRGPRWVRAVPAGEGEHPRVILFVTAFPLLLDLAMRAAGLQPPLAHERSQVALVSAATLSVLVALRFRRRATRTTPGEPADTPEVRTALGQPTEILQFASGVAHEINNPLMAVAGWAELALRRGAPSAPLQALIASARSAAEAVVRLQQVASGERRGSP
jgi:signal transduction histidine kinase